MKRTNPIRSTVSVFIPASVSRKKRSRYSMKDFFEDLGNRGSMHPNSVSQVFTRSVREKMITAGTWIQDDEDNLDFVAEYVTRLLREYLEHVEWRIYRMFIKDEGKFVGYKKEFLEFRKIYLRIRVWGLRTKRFHLRKWPVVKNPMNFREVPQIWAFGFKSVVDQPVYRYILLIWSSDDTVGDFFRKEVSQKADEYGSRVWERI